MKKIIFLTLFVFGFKQGMAQRWFPIGATFTFSQFFWEFPSSMNSAEWKVTDTSTIKGKLCQKFQLTKGSGVLDKSFYEMDIFSDSGRVYWFRPELDTFTILYDFNKLVGESWEIKGVKSWKHSDTTNCTIVMRVMEKGVDTINGFALRTMTIKGDNAIGYAKGFDGKVVEYIGHYRTPRPDPFYSCKAVSESNDFFGLRCFTHPDLGFYDFKLYPSCDYVSTGLIDVFRRLPIDISPNPTSHFFQIDFQNPRSFSTQFIVTDITGRTIYSAILPTGVSTIDASNWSSGVYFYRLIENNEIADYGKLVKQ